jgi:predicted NUDIX family NTP pyrophosphohydrolase
MSKPSAGLLVFRDDSGRLEVFLVHPGGPFWTKKDEGAWSIPKGEFTEDENPLDAARREFEEETGFAVVGEMIRLEPIRQPGRKIIHAWAVRGDLDPSAIKSNTFSLEWPPKSGEYCEFPEVDRAAWFGVTEAGRKMHGGQIGFLRQLEEKLGMSAGGGRAEGSSEAGHLDDHRTERRGPPLDDE